MPEKNADAEPATDLDIGRTEGGETPEKVEDRPNVSRVRPEDYPIDQRNGSRVDR